MRELALDVRSNKELASVNCEDRLHGQRRANRSPTRLASENRGPADWLVDTPLPACSHSITLMKWRLILLPTGQINFLSLAMALRSLSVFFFRSSSSHFTGLISPFALHHLVPVQMPSVRLPSESQTRTAL